MISQQTINKHKYLIYEEGSPKGSIAEVTGWLISSLFPGQQTLRKWKDDKRQYTFTYYLGESDLIKSSPMNYRIISQFIRTHGGFDPAHFNLSPRFLECFWLDFSINYQHNFHKFDSTASSCLFIEDGTPQQQYGEHYPIRPKLNREGHSFTSLQPQILLRIAELRNRLVETSDQALKMNWFFDLRSLIGETVSVIEITLNQIYIKAEYDPLPNWTFDKKKLGDRHGRRFSDKLRWVRQITGNDINAEAHIDGVNKLRELRNHMMHFDPPSLVITIEEAALWLNLVYDVAYLLIKIRQALDEKISINLMNFILQPRVLFNPEAHFSKRLPIKDNEGYASSNWPKTDQKPFI